MELTLDQALQKGVEAHKAGKAQEADKDGEENDGWTGDMDNWLVRFRQNNRLN